MNKPLVDIEALHRAMDAKRLSENVSWRNVAAQVGVSASTLTRLSQGRYPDVESFCRMVRWLGESADNFLNLGSRGSPKLESLPVVINRHLRASKELSPRSAKALETIAALNYRQFKEIDLRERSNKK